MSGHCPDGDGACPSRPTPGISRRGVASENADSFAGIDREALRRIADQTLPTAEEVIRDWGRQHAHLDVDDPADRLIIIGKAEALGGSLAKNIDVLETAIAEAESANGNGGGHGKRYPRQERAAHGEPMPLLHEAAHAELLASVWRDEYRWAARQGSWRHWTGRVWEAVTEPVAVAAAQKELRRHYGLLLAETQTEEEDRRLRTLHGEACRYASVLGALSFLKGEPGFHTAFEEWDAAPYALNCADGLLDLRTQRLRAHDAAELCTKITRWRFGDTESTGAWQRHLERCLPNADVRRQVQRDLGRALVDANLEMSLPIWYGHGRNGKSTTADALIEGLDGYGKTAVANLLIVQRFEQHPTDLADLAGSRLAVCEEIEDGKRLNEARVKRLTGGKTESARFMRCDNFRFRPPTIFLLVNHHPVITGTDKGVWGRLRLVPWEVSIPFAEQRPEEEMLAELMADGSWMLRWMVAGFADWQADHHWIAEEVRIATEEYRVEQDRLAGFLSRKCDLRPFGTVGIAEFYEAYVRDAQQAGEEAMSKILFGKQLRSQGFKQDEQTALLAGRPPRRRAVFR